MAKMIYLWLFIFTSATVSVLSFKTNNESYEESNEKSGTNTVKNLTSVFPEQFNVSLTFDNMELKYLTNGFVKGEFLTDLSLEGNRIERISDMAFGFVPRLTHLNLANNFLENIDLQQFSSIKSLKTLNLNKNCKKQNQVVVEEQTTSHLFNHWRISNYDSTPNYEYIESSPAVKRIPCVVNLSANLPNLSKLYLEDNNLMGLTFSSEMKLPLLTHLYLSNNDNPIGKDTMLNLSRLAPSLSDLHLKISGINKFDASQLTTVTSLYLDVNNINYVCNENCEFHSNFLKLKGAQNLETLSLSMNQISKINPDSFDSTTRLVTLDLSTNRISEILEGTFDKLNMLRFLFLHSNHIVKINAVHTFKNLINLENLSLGHNKILNISGRTFENLVALKTLELNNNEISVIESGTFSDLVSLEKLSLADNQLSNIPDGCMPTSGSLITLNFDNNNFISTEYISFTNLSNLLFLSLKNNPLTAINLHWHSIVSENLTIILNNVCYGEQYY